MKLKSSVQPRITRRCWWNGGFPPIQHPPGGGSYNDLMIRVIQHQQTRFAAEWSQSRVCLLPTLQLVFIYAACSLIHMPLFKCLYKAAQVRSWEGRGGSRGGSLGSNEPPFLLIHSTYWFFVTPMACQSSLATV